MTIGFLRLSILACISAFLFGSVSSYAQGDRTVQSALPVLPMNVRFRLVPQYFVQLISDDPKYSRIEALIDNDPNRPLYEVVLADKTTANRITYTNSQETVNALKRAGKNAYQSDIQFAVSTQGDLTSTYQFSFRDVSGQQIIWKFVANPQESEGQAGFMARPNTSGFVLMKLDHRSSAMTGTAVTIGDVQHPLTISRESGGVQREVSNSGTYYGTGLMIAEIMPGAELWRVDVLPDALKADQQWILHNSGSEKRVLTIESVIDDRVVINQVDQDGSFPVRMDVLQVHGDLLLSSLSVMRQSHSFRITFIPELPFPAPSVDDSTKVGFILSEDNQADIAHGNLLVSRRFNDESVNWKFDATDWARARSIATGASVLIESAINQVKGRR